MHTTLTLRRFGAFMMIVGSAVLAPGGVAFAAGTGVQLTGTPPPPTKGEAKAQATEEAKFQAWLSGQDPVATATTVGTMSAAGAVISASSITPMLVDAPHYQLSTTSHKQATNYYCGPATCQIIDDFWHGYQTQATYAAKFGMCTTSAGTNFYLMDDVLRFFTGKTSYQYYDYSSVTSLSEVYTRTAYALGTKHFPMAYLLTVDGSAWPNYVYDHAGHILCGDGFDWRYNTIAVNDPYPENDPVVGRGSTGGNTYGHKTYGKSIIGNGVLGLWQHAMIY